MSYPDRYFPNGRMKDPLSQIMSSWFLESAARKKLEKHFLLDWKLDDFQRCALNGMISYEGFPYCVVFYQGKIPSPKDCHEGKVFLSFRKLSHPLWTYGYVLVKPAKELNHASN